MSKTTGKGRIARVIIGVKDLDKAVAFYSDLLGATFVDVSPGAEPYGLRAAISWDAGIELFQPLSGRTDSDYARFIDEHGEGISAVAFAVDDLAESVAKAKRMGINIKNNIELDQGQIMQLFNGAFKVFRECELDSADTRGAGLFLAQIEPK